MISPFDAALNHFVRQYSYAPQYLESDRTFSKAINAARDAGATTQDAIRIANDALGAIERFVLGGPLTDVTK